MQYSNNKIITLITMNPDICLKSVDGHMFMVPYDVACISKHIEETLSISDQYDDIPTFDLITINGTTLEAIVKYMKNYKELPFESLESLPDYCNELLDNTLFIYDASDPRVSLTSILFAANMLKIDSIIKIIVGKFKSSLTGKNLKQMFGVFNIPEDTVVTPEEVEKLKNEHYYLFEKNK